MIDNMNNFNEDNVTEQMCIEVAKKAGYTYCPADELRKSIDAIDKVINSLINENL